LSHMALFKKKPPELPPQLKEGFGAEEDILAKLEQETSQLERAPARPTPERPVQPPQAARPVMAPPPKRSAEEMPMPSRKAPPAPIGKPTSPLSKPAPAPEKEEPKKPESDPSLSKQQIAKLPLFMKVEEYDKIVGELTVLVDSLRNMEKIMNKLSELEEEEGEETNRWKKQLNRTKQQVRLLLSGMPETGELQDALKEKVRSSCEVSCSNFAKISSSAPNPSFNCGGSSGGFFLNRAI